MERSSAGWPIDFTDSELKVLLFLADDKGHSEKEIANEMAGEKRHQIVKSKSLSDVDNVNKELGKLEKENIIYYKYRNLPSKKANREYSVKFYRI